MVHNYSFMSGVIIVYCASLSLSLSHSLSLSLFSLSSSLPPSLSTQASKADAAHKDPISRKSASYASSKEVCKFIMELGISKVHVTSNPVTFLHSSPEVINQFWSNM